MAHINGTHDAGAGDQVPILEPKAELRCKLQALATHFKSKYNIEPSYFIRVPGRVNLIGEHIDYCGYAVCPMAIEQHILLAVAPSTDNKIRLTNVDSKYEDFHCDFQSVSAYINNAGEGPTWYKYFLCGVKGALEAIPEERAPAGMLAAVRGNIPANSGLSSSSALVSAALLSTVHAAQYQMSKRDLATISARAERYIGTQGGGMDQAIAFLGKAGSAKLIEFDPLRATDVILPESAVFVIAHSGAYHNKASTADYNLRVAECRLAAQLIAKKRNKDWKSVQKLIDIQEKLGISLKDMADVVKTDLREEPYTLNEICEQLEITHDQMKKSSLSSNFDVLQTFKLRQRSLHVFQEASRVVAFRRINEKSAIPEDERLRQLGSLMSESHASLRELYECSHPSVDDLVDRAMSCGALGARLTGAGWGGCIVSLSTKDKVQQFVSNLKDEIRRVRAGDQPAFNDLVFPTEPNQGAAIYQI